MCTRVPLFATGGRRSLGKPSGLFAFGRPAQCGSSHRRLRSKMPGRGCQAQVRRTAGCVAWLPWALWGSLLLAPAWSYVIVNSVSWSVTNEVEEEMDSSSNEEVLPALLEDTTSIWKQSYPASVYKEEEELRSRPGPGKSKQLSSPSRMFSYRRESAKEEDSLAPQEQAARTARLLVHYNNWGFLATRSTQEKMQGAPFGNSLSISDGPTDNSTGIPFFYVTPKDNTVADLMRNSIASLTLLEAEGDFCRTIAWILSLISPCTGAFSMAHVASTMEYMPQALAFCSCMTSIF
ncbi:UNVERIFIED_CONTAM: hypothetical protein K2H54_040760 [Gekko kuhli]